MVRCHNCGTENLDGSEYCDECGMRLGEKRPSTADLMRPPAAPSFTSSTSVPRPATPASPHAGPPHAGPPPAHPQASGGTLFLSSTGANVPAIPTAEPPPANPAPSTRAAFDAAVPSGVEARLVIERGGRVGKDFPIAAGETNIGRWDADGGIFPDVDLDQDDPEAKVSRRHARIIVENSQFYIEDLGSTNGTFINRGRRLLPGNRHPLNNGDEIIVGKTFLKFVVDGAPY
jgi:pSer/pThr/pTyr-binding forkhead associated (FHA) protein